MLLAFPEVRNVFIFHPRFAYCKPFYAIKLRITMCTHVCEEENSPLLCGFTATLFGSMPLAYEDSVMVKIGLGRNNTLPNFLSCFVFEYPAC